MGHETGRALEAVGHVGDEVAGPLEGDVAPLAPLVVDEVAQRLPVEELGGDEEVIGLAPGGQHLDQVLVDEGAGVLDVRHQLRGGRADRTQRDDADRGRAAPVGVGGPVGLTDRILTQERVEPESTADDGAGLELPGGADTASESRPGAMRSATLTKNGHKPKPHGARLRFICSLPPAAASWPARSSRPAAARWAAFPRSWLSCWRRPWPPSAGRPPCSPAPPWS